MSKQKNGLRYRQPSLASAIQKLPLAEAYLDLMNSVGNREDEIKNPSLHPLWAFSTGKIVVTLRTEKQ